MEERWPGPAHRDRPQQPERHREGSKRFSSTEVVRVESWASIEEDSSETAEPVCEERFSSDFTNPHPNYPFRDYLHGLSIIHTGEEYIKKYDAHGQGKSAQETVCNPIHPNLSMK